MARQRQAATVPMVSATATVRLWARRRQVSSATTAQAIEYPACHLNTQDWGCRCTSSRVSRRS